MISKELLFEPNVRLYGPIGDDSVRDCLKQIRDVLKSDKPLVFELTTQGGDADGGRRIALEVKLCRKWHGRQTYFIGKTAVMSAGITIMAAFPRDNRYLTEDTVLLIHERRLQKTIELNGPMRANIQIAQELLAQFQSAEAIERAGFAELAEGSKLSLEELYERATKNCYLTAQEALDLQLIAGVV